MNPLIEEILNRIGFAEARLYHRSLLPLGGGIDNKGGRAFRSPVDAMKAKKHLGKVAKAIDELPEEARELWDHSSRSSKDWDAGRSILDDALGLGLCARNGGGGEREPQERTEGAFCRRCRISDGGNLRPGHGQSARRPRTQHGRRANLGSLI